MEKDESLDIEKQWFFNISTLLKSGNIRGFRGALGPVGDGVES